MRRFVLRATVPFVMSFFTSKRWWIAHGVGLLVLTHVAGAMANTSSAKPTPVPKPVPLQMPKPVPVPAAVGHAPAAGASTRSPIEQSAGGIVFIENKGKHSGLGFVLRGDGRIVTALSNLGDGSQVSVRYPSSPQPVVAKLGHSDSAWDLALLVPQSGRWAEGLRPSSADASTASSIVAFSKRGNAVRTAPMKIRGKVTLASASQAPLPDAIELATPVAADSVGAPLVGTDGAVLGVVAKACKASQAGVCRSTTFGVPMSALRKFLRSVPRTAVAPRPWLGVQGTGVNRTTTGVRVLQVHAGETGAPVPDASKTLLPRDVIVAFDGVAVQSIDQLAELVKSRALGDQVQVIVIRDSKYLVVPITLTQQPPGLAKITESSKPAVR